jgi:hypothetical protein
VSRHDSKGGGKYPNGVATVGGGTVLLGTNEGMKSEAALCLILDLDSLLWFLEWWLEELEWWLGDFVLWLDEEVLDEDFVDDEIGGVADVVLEGVAWDQEEINYRTGTDSTLWSRCTGWVELSVINLICYWESSMVENHPD